jgi:protein O-mannosyl-transferase
MVDNSHEKRQIRLICLGLALAVLAAYAPVWQCGYVGYDDPQYVTSNPAIQQGVSWTGLDWAFTNQQLALWHPLTWISLLLDSQFFGLNAAGHHATSLFLHLANSLLLFLLLRRMTGAPWAGALTAALFALHPLHVESVAWISERKDVLSTFFWMLSVWNYIRYSEEQKAESRKQKCYYGLALVFFALGLMSKPMVVTLPFILLLLDYWPLGRMKEKIESRKQKASAFAKAAADKENELRSGSAVSFWGLAGEKVPFFLLGAGFCAVTLLFARNTGTLLTLHTLPLKIRLGYIPIEYVRYIAKTFWPAHLQIYYPYPAQLVWWQCAGAAALLLLITGWALVWARRQPWLIVGWLWFLGALVPAIGLVQDSNAAMSDHYTYIPIVGLFVMVVWSAREWGRAWPARTGAWLAAAAVGVCLVLTPRQVGYWQNDTTLYTHAMAVSQDNYLSYYNLGCDYAEAGETGEALGCFQKAVACSGKVILFEPDQAFANLGIALAKKGRLDEAAAQYRQALNLNPNNPYAQNGLGSVLESQNKWDEAAAHYSAAIAAKPDLAESHDNLGVILTLQGKFAQAEEQFAQALQLQPGSASIHFDFGNTLLREIKLRPAADQYLAAARLRPDDLQSQLNLALVYSQLGEAGKAIPRFRAVLRLNPKDVQVTKRLAWILATDPDSRNRSAVEAMELAARATQLAPGDAAAWDTEAAALAEAGRFTEAAAAAAKALALAASAHEDLLPKIQARLQLYQSGRAFRE